MKILLIFFNFFFILHMYKGDNWQISSYENPSTLFFFLDYWKDYAQYYLCDYSVYSREIINMSFVGQVFWLVKNFNTGIYSGAINVIIIICLLIARVVGAPQMISQPVSSIFPCSPLPSRTRRTPGLSLPWCCLPTSSSVCPVFFPLALCLARRFWPDLMNRRHAHTTAVCVSLRRSGGLRVVRLPAGSWHGLPRW